MKIRFACAAALAIVALSSHARADETVPIIHIDDDPTPVVHVDASSAVTLQQVDAGGHTTPVCKAPCDRALDVKKPYELTGEGLRASNRFHLPPSGNATVSVEPRSKGGFVAGIVLMSVSGALATGAAVFLGLTVALSSGNSDFVSSLGDSFAGVFTGLGAIVCGVGSLATGIPGILLLTNNIESRAKVTEGDQRTTAPRPVLPSVHAAPIVSFSF